MTTITASSTQEINLSATIDTNPVVIASGVSISAAGQAVFGSNVPWTLQNQGTLIGSLFGVFLGDGGAVTNAASAIVTGVYDGVKINGGTGIVSNYGAISGTGSTGIGVYLDLGGLVTNAVSAHLSGVGYGVFIFGGAGAIANYGSLAAFGTASTGIDLADGGWITNAATAVVEAMRNGVSVSAAAGTVSNNGAIEATGASGTGINLAAGGFVTNAASGAVTGGANGIVISGHAGTVVNYGVIAGGTAFGDIGIRLNAGGTVINGAGGVIDGVSITSQTAGTVVMEPGASFTGPVNGGNAAGSVLELASGSSSGTISGIGSAYTNFPNVIIGAGANWNLIGSDTITAGQTLTEQSGATAVAPNALTNNGRIIIDPSTMTLAGLVGAGSVTIGTGSALDVQGTVFATQTIAFAGSGAYLHLETPVATGGAMANFAPGDTIDLKGINASSVTLAGGLLQFAGGSFPLSLSGATSVQAITSGDGTDVTALCFCVNTLIQTPAGQVPVQDLSVGDAVLTWSGAIHPIVWIGKGRVLATRGRRSAATPVIVRKHALDHSVPNRDLRLTKGHALYLENVLVPVEELVNHRSIEWDDRAQEVEVFHIELATHDVLIANGAPAESYRDDGNRWLFHNTRQDVAITPQHPCAPLLTDGPTVDALWRRLMQRVGPRKDLRLTDDPDLHVLVDDKRVDAIEQRDGTYAFRLPEQRRHVRICSRSGVPQELGTARDPRRLGVALRRIVLAVSRRQRVIEADDLSLADGYHAFETGSGIRWTDGNAGVPAALFTQMGGPAMLMLHLGTATQYPDDGRPANASAA